jgi:hypothetical protein
VREGKMSKAYGKFCSNCIGYVEQDSWCLIKDCKTKPGRYCIKYIANEEKSAEYTRYCEHCGHECVRTVSANTKVYCTTGQRETGSEWNYLDKDTRYKTGDSFRSSSNRR